MPRSPRMGESGHEKTTQRSETMNHPKFTCNHINQKQLADRWELSERTLERWRAIGRGPLFLKIGGRVVYWLISCVLAILTSDILRRSRSLIALCSLG